MHNKSDDKPLPMSNDSMAGMTPNAQGDASRADVARGYFKVGENTVNRGPFPPPDADMSLSDGFAGRPAGWER